MPKKTTIDIITLGCSKNLVDSEQLIRQLEGVGFTVSHDPKEPNGEIAVINTCGFIDDAKEESINMILSFAQRKDEGKLRQLYVMGCLSQLYSKELTAEIPQVDKFYGKFNWKELLSDLGKVYQEELRHKRTITTPGHYAYIKISEGCNRSCAYCSIPVITGAHVSRPMDEIIDEVGDLVSNNVKEFQIIAQDITSYGIDLYKKPMLPQLIDRIASINGVEWIRLHYAYPVSFPYDILDVMRSHNNVCKYLDIAFQHISDRMLHLMRRKTTKRETYQLINRIREKVPGIHLRTTLMVGHPGETQTDFDELKDFIKEIRFERMGAFMYSAQEGTYADKYYTDNVPQQIKQVRLDELMDIQQNISADINSAKIGESLKVIIDRKEGNYYIGRTEFDSPDVDPEVIIDGGKVELNIGDFYTIKVYKSNEFDLYGQLEQQIIPQ